MQKYNTSSPERRRVVGGLRRAWGSGFMECEGDTEKERGTREEPWLVHANGGGGRKERKRKRE
jgi:hypothetical protein